MPAQGSHPPTHTPNRINPHPDSTHSTLPTPPPRERTSDPRRQRPATENPPCYRHQGPDSTDWAPRRPWCTLTPSDDRRPVLRAYDLPGRGTRQRLDRSVSAQRPVEGQNTSRQSARRPRLHHTQTGAPSVSTRNPHPLVQSAIKTCTAPQRLLRAAVPIWGREGSCTPSHRQTVSCARSACRSLVVCALSSRVLLLVCLLV